MLNEAESHHCMRVKRLKFGDVIGITDGKGNIFKGSFMSFENKRCVLEDISVSYTNPKKPEIQIAFGILKNSDRMEWMVEKLTELGTGSIQPLITQRVERKKINLERLAKKAISAIKQSHNPWLPEILSPIPLKEYLKSKKNNNPKYIAHINEANPNLSSNDFHEAISILIGPEGGFEKTEVDQAMESGFMPFTLGPHILRTETAALAAVTRFNL